MGHKISGILFDIGGVLVTKLKIWSAPASRRRSGAM
jgi:hypothetical protein